MKIFILTAVILILSSCSARNQADVLDDVESFISEDPERALSVLDSLSSSGELPGHEAKARFALLYSMALDKNYIDSTDDSLINVAVKWYRRHGSPDEKLKSYYYQGRIYQNAGDKESAMESFVKAEAYVADAEDDIAAGLLYTVMNDVYTDIFDLESAYSCNKKAMEYYLKAGDIDKYAGRLLYLSDFHYANGDYKAAAACLDSVKSIWNDISDSRKINYYSSSMQMKAVKKDYYELSKELDEYIKNFDHTKIFWHDVVDNYTIIGDYNSAQWALIQYRKYNQDYKYDPAYYLVSSSLNSEIGNYKAALEDFEVYSDLSDSLSMVIAEQDTGFIKERYEKELKIEKEKNLRNIIMAVSSVILILIGRSSYLLYLRLKAKNEENRKFKENYAVLEKEKNTLSKIISENPPIGVQARKVMSDRLALLDRFFAAEITSDSEIDRKASKDLSRLVDNRENFMYTTRMTFAAANPRFICYLEDKGLTETEIEYCCLYVIGLKGKDIGNYIRKKRHYIYSSEIRKKLGLGEHDTNLGIYLRNLLTEKNQ